MSRGRAQLKRRRKRLFREHPFCFYCGGRVVKAKNKPNSATIDHVISRNNPLRGKVLGKTVLACNACNGQRAAEEVAALPNVELWRRAGHLERMLNPKRGIHE